MHVLIAIFCPPAAVALAGHRDQLLLNCFLTLFCWIPGVVHALVLMHAEEGEQARPESREILSPAAEYVPPAADQSPELLPHLRKTSPAILLDEQEPLQAEEEAPEPEAIRNVLVVGLPASPYRRLEPLLRRAKFEVDRVPQASSAVGLLQAVSFDIVILAYPLDGPSVADLLTIIRSEDSPCQRSAVRIIASEDRVHEAEALIDSGPTRVVSMESPAEALQQEVSSLLRVAPRLSARITVRAELEREHGAAMTLSQTDNVSVGGMLMRTRRRVYPVGSSLNFELQLPADPTPITGRGTVVRHTQEEKDGIRGVGVRFVDFESDGEQRLKDYIDATISDGDDG
jgi:uncharacterized protein (TIGR02266 family)